VRKTEADEDALRRIMQRLVRCLGALATDHTPCGQPLSIAHAHALLVLRASGERSQQELGAELCIDKSNVARLCAKMVEAGHASQRPSDQDGRSRRVSLTARGKRLAREVDAASRTRFGALLAALPARHRGDVIEALHHLVAALEALPAPTDERKSG
jgi:DNA-binding MarR family transcriptional regulator